MRDVPYLTGPVPRVLAHRGNMDGHDENTLAAFRAALAAGADIIESDIQVTSDDVAVLFHDNTLERLTGDRRAISEVSWAELAVIRLPQGGHIPRLEDALTDLPDMRFNLDLKAPQSSDVACAVIESLHAEDRVLLTSFNERHRRRALHLLPGVATSPSAALFLWILVAGKLGLGVILRRLCRGVAAVQIPMRALGCDTTTPLFLRRLHSAGVEVHYWVVDDDATIRRLLENGADGIVTDQTAIARTAVDRFVAER